MAEIVYPSKQEEMVLLLNDIITSAENLGNKSFLKESTLQELIALKVVIDEKQRARRQARKDASTLGEEVTILLGTHKKQSVEDPGTLANLFRTVILEIKAIERVHDRAPEAYGFSVIVNSTKHRSSSNDVDISESADDSTGENDLGKQDQSESPPPGSVGDE